MAKASMEITNEPPVPPDLEGYLMKLKRKTVMLSRNWNKRWFYIDKQKKMLAYTKNDNEHIMSGGIYLNDITAITVFNEVSFQVESRERNFFLKGESHAATSGWVKKLQKYHTHRIKYERSTRYISPTKKTCTETTSNNLEGTHEEAEPKPRRRNSNSGAKKRNSNKSLEKETDERSITTTKTMTVDVADCKNNSVEKNTCLDKKKKKKLKEKVKVLSLHDDVVQSPPKRTTPKRSSGNFESKIASQEEWADQFSDEESEESSDMSRDDMVDENTVMDSKTTSENTTTTRSINPLSHEVSCNNSNSTSWLEEDWQ